MKSVAIIGYGHVGKTMQQIFPEAVIYDINLDQYKSNRPEANKCYLGIVCVPTPENPDGTCDISVVQDVVSWLETPLILIKSTVPPGTTDYLKTRFSKRIAFSPEYSGESTYYLPEAFSPLGWPFLTVGGDKTDTRAVVEVFQPRLGPAKTFLQTDARTAELTKYMDNAWLAMQVTFANEFWEIARVSGVDYGDLREAWALDPRVSKYHTLVFADRRGFGGKCLPKDLKAIISTAEQQGYSPQFLQAIWANNLRFTEKNHVTGDHASEERLR